MNKIRQLSVGNQVMLIFGLICALLVAVGLFLFFSLRTIERNNEKLQSQMLHEWKISNDLSRDLSMTQIEIFQHVQTQDSEEMKIHDRNISSIEAEDGARLDAYGKLVDNELETHLYAGA